MSLSFAVPHFGNHMQFAGIERLWSASYAREIRSHAGRRHHRRRPGNLDWGSDDWSKIFVMEKRQPILINEKEDDKIEITLDFKDFRKRASEAAIAAKKAIQVNLEKLSEAGSSFAYDSAKTWQDLRTSVAVQKDARIVIALRSSTLDFIARGMLGCLILVVLGRLFIKLARRYRWGWEEGFGWQGLVRRDRSLGGREVIVSTSGRKSLEKSTVTSSRTKPKTFNPLDGVEPPRSEKNLSISRKQTENSKSRQQKLPKWWPRHDLPPVKPSLQAQTEANYVVQAIMNKRLSGTDFTEEDMLKIRQICRESGAKVSFGSSNTRDSFYRAAIDFVLSLCSRNTRGSSAPFICNESAVDYLVGLATDIGLDAGRAATMINAAVAARTRSSFLQAWALSLQGNFTEAENEIVKLVQIHAIFSPEPNSPEMEMVARGLETYLDVDERKELLQIYKKAGGSALEGVAKEALGLVSIQETRY
ncbi:hypothetical protein O6H91_05G021100 [Diphasiastrum complanatum]|uniref:Uncharacterized protein n=1 Tax=Diphasiastrum complanatum TaxID=34168 RepID=A0ACC2DLA9_DIPCM|nr:hypothetical protein O6H91_05G021100 [Diphasiastrum complanatum]